MPAYSRTLSGSPERIADSLKNASTVPFWLDAPERPLPCHPLPGTMTTDLLVVGGGYCGLWTALLARERHPNRTVMLIEAREVGWAASGRNGGFCESSLTHGPDNGERHFAGELPQLERLAAENFAEFEASLTKYGIDAEFEKTGVLTVATEEHQIDDLRTAAAADASGSSTFFDGDTIQGVVASPLYRAGLLQLDGVALVHPAKLAWGLKQACLDAGVIIYENTPALSIARSPDGVTVRTGAGSISAAQVALATNGFPSLLKRTRLLTVPLYDYVLMTEPLSQSQLQSIGWTIRHGITDSSRQFHYYRLTADNRILWGGYDAVYHPGGRIRDSQDQRPETFEMLADHFFTTFPQLADISFTHKWGGMIDMSTRFVAFHGSAISGRVAYSAGFTGLGVGATRFAAKVMLDLLSGESTELTRLKMVRSTPLPIPPEPFARPLIQITRKAIERSDENGGRDGILLRTMEVFGVGFDS